MKKYIGCLVSLMIMSSSSFGSIYEGKTKEELSNYEIIVTNKKTGEVVGRMTRDQYKVVSLDSEETPLELPPNVLVSINRLKQSIKESYEVSNKYRTGYNTLIFHAGIGKTGILINNDGNFFNVSNRFGPVGGFTVCRSADGTGFCMSGFTHGTVTLGLKFDY